MTDISYSNCCLCCVDKWSRLRGWSEVRDAIPSGQRRHFNRNSSEVKKCHLTTWGKSVPGRGNSMWVLEEEQTGGLGRLVRSKGSKSKGRRAEGEELDPLGLLGHGKRFGFYSECGRFWTKYRHYLMQIKKKTTMPVVWKIVQRPGEDRKTDGSWLQ